MDVKGQYKESPLTSVIDVLVRGIIGAFYPFVVKSFLKLFRNFQYWGNIVAGFWQGYHKTVSGLLRLQLAVA